MKPKKRNRKLIALIVTLVVLLIVVPAIAAGIGHVIKARWEADHPVTTIVPNLTGRDRAAAEAAIRNAQLQPIVSFTNIKDKCWQDQPAPNTVVDQDPAPIIPAPIGSEVHLVIGLEDPKVAAVDKRCCGQ